MLTNTGTTAGFVTLLQARGKGIYDYETLTAIAENTVSQTAYQEHEHTLDLTYQSDLDIATNIAGYTVGLYSSPTAQVQSIRFEVPATDYSLLHRLVQLEISHRIGIAEQMTGVAQTDPVSGAAVGFFINGFDWQIDDRNNFVVTLTLAPASQLLAWQLETPGRSELGDAAIPSSGTCILGWGGLTS